MQKLSLFNTGLTIDEFLRDYWQQQPLLIRQAFPKFHTPIDADELAGLAMEEFVESRLVFTKDWQVQHGPFSEKTLTTLPKSHWTLLVQGVDQLVPDVAAILAAFRFLPSWRLDDIMISYATDGGGVGPHFDHYDVFLLQGMGQRRWQVGSLCDGGEELLPDSEMAILKNFNTLQDYLLEPGDMLYLPPKFAHWGTAVGDCMTYSIGFRAPSTQEMISSFCDDRLETLDNSLHYRDQPLNSNMDSYQIPTAVVRQLRQQLLSVIDNENALAEWFGRFSTTPRYAGLDGVESGAVTVLSDGTEFERTPGARCAYYLPEISLSDESPYSNLFFNGKQWRVSKQFAQFICHREHFRFDEIRSCMQSPIDQDVLRDLISEGALTIG